MQDSQLEWSNTMRYMILLLIALLVPVGALAKGECKEDRQKFCKDVAKPEVGACLDKHVAELSAACKDRREAKAKKKEAKKKKESTPDRSQGGAESPESKDSGGSASQP
jgi:hypothetical protein